MREDPPQTPPGANLVFNAARGPRVPPGAYAVRLTKGTNVYTMPLAIGLDRRATFTIADRKAQYDAAKRVSGLFGRMSRLVAGIVQVRDGAKARATGLPESDALRHELDGLAGDADALRKKIVATKEGGAITGEERLREHMDYVIRCHHVGRGSPTPYQIARVNVLEHELKDVENSFGDLMKGKLASANAGLKAKGLEEITVRAPSASAGGGGGGAAGARSRKHDRIAPARFQRVTRRSRRTRLNERARAAGAILSRRSCRRPALHERLARAGLKSRSNPSRGLTIRNHSILTAKPHAIHFSAVSQPAAGTPPQSP